MDKTMWKSKLGRPPMAPPPATAAPDTSTTSGALTDLDLGESTWDKYFESSEEIIMPSNSNNKFKVYKSGPGPEDTTSTPLFVLLHGAGHSALSWSFTVNEMKIANCRVLAYDCRGHGSTSTDNDDDLSVDTLTNDAVELINTVNNGRAKVIIVGHSMGGAIAARAAASGRIINLVAVAVLDVVEGTAMAALSHMHGILENRPQSFDSLESAVQWSISSGTLRNLESAKVSIPPQLCKRADGKYHWRTDLFKSEQFWKGWFSGLSQIFLSAKVIKLLILAGTDRLDKDLTIGQMQGKFQLVLLPACGHVVQEDDPKKVAEALIQAKQRYRF